MALGTSAAMEFVALYDACVLYPAPRRDRLVRLANTGVVRAPWSAAVLDERSPPPSAPVRGRS